jgi:hypothetical protein
VAVTGEKGAQSSADQAARAGDHDLHASQPRAMSCPARHRFGISLNRRKEQPHGASSAPRRPVVG